MSAQQQRLYFLLQLAAHGLRIKADSTVLEAVHLSTAQAAVLAVLADRGAMSQKQLSQQQMQRESAMTTMVSRLLKAEYVSRRRSREDARAWTLELTAQGRLALEQAAVPFGKVNELLDACFPAAELEQLAHGLRALIEQLAKDDRLPLRPS